MSQRVLVTAGYWIERRGVQVMRTDIEPGTSFWQRVEVSLLSLLPIERFL